MELKPNTLGSFFEVAPGSVYNVNDVELKPVARGKKANTTYYSIPKSKDVYYGVRIPFTQIDIPKHLTEFVDKSLVYRFRKKIEYALGSEKSFLLKWLGITPKSGSEPLYVNYITFKYQNQPTFSLYIHGDFNLTFRLYDECWYAYIYFEPNVTSVFTTKQYNVEFDETDPAVSISHYELPTPSVLSLPLLRYFLFHGLRFQSIYKQDMSNFKKAVQPFLDEINGDYYWGGTSDEAKSKDLDLFVGEKYFEDFCLKLAMEGKFGTEKTSLNSFKVMYKDSNKYGQKMDVVKKTLSPPVTEDKYLTEEGKLFAQTHYYTSIANTQVTPLFKTYRFNKVLECTPQHELHLTEQVINPERTELYLSAFNVDSRNRGGFIRHSSNCMAEKNGQYLAIMPDSPFQTCQIQLSQSIKRFEILDYEVDSRHGLANRTAQGTELVIYNVKDVCLVRLY